MAGCMTPYTIYLYIKEVMLFQGLIEKYEVLWISHHKYGFYDGYSRKSGVSVYGSYIGNVDPEIPRLEIPESRIP